MSSPEVQCLWALFGGPPGYVACIDAKKKQLLRQVFEATSETVVDTIVDIAQGENVIDNIDNILSENFSDIG